MNKAQQKKRIKKIKALVRERKLISQSPLPEGFIEWDGDYEKEWYSVILKTGEVVKECWPNAGFMNEMGGKARKFLPHQVLGIKPVKPEW